MSLTIVYIAILTLFFLSIGQSILLMVISSDIKSLMVKLSTTDNTRIPEGPAQKEESCG